MYLTYEEYQNMGGTLDETVFNDYEFEAESWVNWYTFNRLKNETNVSQEVVKCVYHLIKLMQMKAESLGIGNGENSNTEGGNRIASQSNDGVSISYNVLSASEAAKSAETEIQGCIDRYLNGVINSLGQKVLYRGLYPGE